MSQVRRVLVFFITCYLAACTPQLQISAAAVAGIVAKKVADGVFGKTVFDPIWDFYFGKDKGSELKDFKNDFIKEAVDSVVRMIIPEARADDKIFRCNAGEDIKTCTDRVTKLAAYGFDVYAPKFLSAFEQCKDDIGLSPTTGVLDFTDQVGLINQCISDKGFEREISVILLHIQKRSSNAVQ